MTHSSWTVEPDAAGIRLDKFLAEAGRLGSRSRAAAALDRHKVFLNGEEVDIDRAAVRLSTGDVVRVWSDRPGSARRRPTSVRSASHVPVVYEDEALVVVNKPPGLLAVPLERRSKAPSVYDLLQEHLRSTRRRPFVVHRIDRDTSGLVVFAKDAQTQQQLRAQFKRREPDRVYLAVVRGHPDPPTGTWRDWITWDRKALIQKPTHARDPRGKEAVSRYRVVESFETASLVEVTLQTGRRNQIRLQAHLHGHPLVGEQRYSTGNDRPQPIAFPRQALHASRLTFRHPRDGRVVRFEAPLPDDIGALLAELRRS